MYVTGVPQARSKFLNNKLNGLEHKVNCLPFTRKSIFFLSDSTWKNATQASTYPYKKSLTYVWCELSVSYIVLSFTSCLQKLPLCSRNISSQSMTTHKVWPADRECLHNAWFRRTHFQQPSVLPCELNINYTLYNSYDRGPKILEQ